MREDKRPKVRQSKKLSGRIEQQPVSATKQQNQQENQHSKPQEQSKEVLGAEVPVFKQLSPLWQDFYYHVISKVKS